MNRADPLPGPLGLVLAPFGALYGALGRLRVSAYRRGLLRSHRPPWPTLSIGNLAVGGTGKTPLLFHVLEWLERHHLRAGVLSRGYGGDEGRMLEQRHPRALLVEDPDRVRGLQRLQAAGEGPEVLVLDDGFQHLRLRRDLDVVLLDATRPFGRCLPAGRFREQAGALRRAHLVVLARADLVPAERVEAAWRRVAAVRRGLPPLPRLEGRVSGRELRNLGNGSVAPLERLAGMEALAAAGVGNPGSFEALLQRAGARLTARHYRRDHHAWRPADLRDWERHHNVLVTEKDAVKLRALLPDGLAERVWEVRVDWSFTRGGVDWEAALERLSLPVRAARIEPLWTAHDPHGRAVPGGGAAGRA